MSDDLEPLLPLPFSASQIVTAKLVIVSSSPVLIGIGILNSVCLGYGIREGAGITFVIGTLLSSILIPVTGISAAVILLAVLAVRAFYLDTALSMQNTSTKSKPVSDELIRSNEKNSVLKALTLYEAKSSRRNPAYMIYGFVLTLI